MALTELRHGNAIELQLSLYPERRDQVSVWVLEGVIVDSGGQHTAPELVAWLRGKLPDAVLLGHHHEDHAAGAALLARHGVPVYGSRGTAYRLRRPAPIPDYRALLWGQREPLAVRPVPDGAPLQPVPLPGHSPDQLGYLDARTGWLFSGDLVLRRRQQIAMRDEDPAAMMASLRHAVEMRPEALATSHRSLIRPAAPALRESLLYLEELAGGVRALRARGLTITAIVRELFGGEPVVAPGGLTWKQMSHGEFSAANWVRSFLRR